MKCPSCGNKGRHDSRPSTGEPPAFEFRGRLGTKVVLRCLSCDRGIFVRPLPGPGRYKAISSEQWKALDAFWQMRRAEILADLQVFLEYAGQPPPDRVVPESQVNFPGRTLRQTSLFHELQVAGYPATAENVSDLINNRPAEFARVALTARSKNVVHDGYEELLAVGGASKSDVAERRINSASDALSKGEDGIRAFLNEAAASRETGESIA